MGHGWGFLYASSPGTSPHENFNRTPPHCQILSPLLPTLEAGGNAQKHTCVDTFAHKPFCFPKRQVQGSLLRKHLEPDECRARHLQPKKQQLLRHVWYHMAFTSLSVEHQCQRPMRACRRFRLGNGPKEAIRRNAHKLLGGPCVTAWTQLSYHIRRFVKIGTPPPFFRRGSPRNTARTSQTVRSLGALLTVSSQHPHFK